MPFMTRKLRNPNSSTNATVSEMPLDSIRKSCMIYWLATLLMIFNLSIKVPSFVEHEQPRLHQWNVDICCSTFHQSHQLWYRLARLFGCHAAVVSIVRLVLQGQVLDLAIYRYLFWEKCGMTYHWSICGYFTGVNIDLFWLTRFNTLCPEKRLKCLM